MKNKNNIIAISAMIAAALVTYVCWAALRAHRNLVTLDVRNMQVREVVKLLEHQTWENIYVHKNVQGKVSLNVRGVPLDDVLRTIGSQTFSRSLVLYPLYSDSKSLEAFKASVRGDLDPAGNGWKSLLAAFGPNRGGPGGPGGMMVTFGGPNPFGAMAENPNQLVSLEIRGKDLAFTTLAFSRFAQARLVPEDAPAGNITLSLNKVPVEKAIARVAKKADRKWTKVYVLQGGFGGPGQGPGRGPGPGGPQFAGMQRMGFDGPDRRGPDARDPNDPRQNEAREQRAVLEEELKAALPAEERQTLDQEQAKREQQMQELANLSPEQRRDRMQQMMGGPGGMDRGNRQRVINSTPEQRAEMNRMERQMRQNGQNGGFGGRPRGPGG